MCGIYGYKGTSGAPAVVKDGLSKLEYRGYDSWGIAYISNGKLTLYKKIGAIGDVLELNLNEQSNISIGHTRWATHGGVKQKNAHPHLSTDSSFALAQNGIVENFQSLKTKLEKKKYVFKTETDTEVIVRLLEDYLKKEKDFFTALRKTFLDLEGRNTVMVLNRHEKKIYAVRNGSPLAIGVGENEFFVASDTLSFAEKTDRVVEVENYEMVVVGEVLKKYSVKNGKEIKYKIQKFDFKQGKIDKEGYDHFMIKEIIEQKHTIKNATMYTYEELFPFINAIKHAGHVYTIGAGTAYFACSQIAYALRRIGKLNVTEIKAYEISSYRDLFQKDDVIIAASQSGETADTIEALEIAKKKGVIIGSIVNMVGSSIGKMSDHLFLARSGPEICVAATKSFTAQVAWGYLIAYCVVNRYNMIQKKIDNLSLELERLFESNILEKIDKLVIKFLKQEHFFILGKGKNYNIALEGALKVKEISYKHFEGFASGELKHGVIALIEKNVPVFLIVSEDENKADMISATAEVKARGAYTIGIARENNEFFDYFIQLPHLKELDPIINVIPFQLLAYSLAVNLGLNPDKPRNLAKSVTVK